MKLKELEKRLKQEPGNLGLRVQVAGLLRETGRSIEAVEHYRAVAVAYRDQGRTQQAIAVCRSILEIAPDDAACQGLLAMLQGKTAPALSKAVPVVDDTPPPQQPQKTPSVPPIASRQATNSSGPISVPSVPSLRPPTPRPTDAPPVEARSRPVVTPVPIARPTPDERPLARTTDPIRRSSIDETPLPKPLPYHLADRTSQPSKISLGDLELPLVEGADTRPGHEERRSEATTTTGLAQAARRISGLLDSKGVPHELDLSAELDTRQRARIPPEQLETIDMLPATPPLDAPVASFIDRLELDDLTTPPPVDDVQTEQVRQLTPIPRGSEDALTPPPLAPPQPIVSPRTRPTSPPPAPRAHPTTPPVLRPNPATRPAMPLAAKPAVPAPPKRPTPSVPSLANRVTPTVPVAAPVKRPTPAVPPLRSSAVPPATRPTPSVPRPTPTSLPPPPSGGTSSRPSLVAVIPPRGSSSRSSITIETRGTKSNPPTDVDEELTQPRDRLGLDDDDD
ncbi:MAG: hypothetical protein HOV81_37955 [Kofleriaceae bacterium]|nr:hypothetical protein [Kofleriaceae bacterium]